MCRWYISLLSSAHLSYIYTRWQNSWIMVSWPSFQVACPLLSSLWLTDRTDVADFFVACFPTTEVTDFTDSFVSIACSPCSVSATRSLQNHQTNYIAKHPHTSSRLTTGKQRACSKVSMQCSQRNPLNPSPPWWKNAQRKIRDIRAIREP